MCVLSRATDRDFDLRKMPQPGGGAIQPHGGAAEYTDFGNILNLALVVKDDRDEYMVVAAWLETHDHVIKELLR